MYKKETLRKKALFLNRLLRNKDKNVNQNKKSIYKLFYMADFVSGIMSFLWHEIFSFIHQPFGEY